MIAPPHGIRAIRLAYGDITVRQGRVVTPGWEDRMVLLPSLPGWARRLYVHGLIVDPLTLALARCVALGDGYLIQSLGCFSPRAKRSDPAQLSLHSWGVAVDLNQATNPVGERGDIPDAWIEIWEAIGWTWGGRFRRRDPMHMQWASGY